MAKGKIIRVSDSMQEDYEYELAAPAGRGFDEAFTPVFTPAEMLAHGVFEGKYLNDCRDEFPASWFAKANSATSPTPRSTASASRAGSPCQSGAKMAGSSAPIRAAGSNGIAATISAADCRKSTSPDRPMAQLRPPCRTDRANCEPHDLSCRPRQRQALLQWSYDPFI